MLKLYTFFHLNAAYSAIEEEDQATIVDRCYWPLLRLARRCGLPFGIELSGYTLETIAALDKNWVRELRDLVNGGPCELIGNGYAQVIGPLVPPEITAVNLRIGMDIYERLLGCRPKVALLNEQAYAAGVVPLYQRAGYHALIMEWNNPKRGHPEWDPEWRYLPQVAAGPEGEHIWVIWNKSIAFQKFQHYVHGEIELDEMLAYLRGHFSERVRAFPLYGNDVEIFNFRPGRYMTEAPLHDDGEWVRIERLFASIQEENENISLISPSEVLTLKGRSSAGQVLRLESAAQPTPVKKQEKYNIARWAVSGRDDIGINTRCWRLFETLRESPRAADSDWKELCFLWSSDFRTHITEARWQRYLAQLERCSLRWQVNTNSEDLPESFGRTSKTTPPPPVTGPTATAGIGVVPAAAGSRRNFSRTSLDSMPLIQRRGRFLEVQGDRLQVRFNCRRGLALDAFSEHGRDGETLCGTLHHGYFDDIRWGADYYSGHLILESPGRPKITDLNPVEPEVSSVDGGLRLSGVVATPLGPINKSWWIDDARGRLVLSLRLHWEEPLIGSLRLGHVTLMPDAFDAETLCYCTHNGGYALEHFPLKDTDFSHGRAVSFLVSASHAIGLTGGVVELGDDRRRVRVCFDNARAALIGLVTHHRVQESHFTRLALSASEVDDTSCPAPIGPLQLRLQIEAVDTVK